MISIITPTYNRKEMLLDVINCIKNQTYQDFELIIVDDCSTDGTKEMMQNYTFDKRIKYFRNGENKGPGYNRNFGFKKATGEYIIFMDDDDYYIDNCFFEKAIHVFENNTYNNLCLVTANAYVENVKLGIRKLASIGIKGNVDGTEFLMNLGRKYAKPQSTFTSVFKAEALKKADISNMKMVNDYAIYLRALLYGDVYVIEDAIGVYRVHSNNISSRIEKSFLLDNLAERVWVKERLLNKMDKKNIEKWWKNQMIILLKYFLLGTNPSLKDGWEVGSFMIRNSTFSFIFSIIIYLMVFSYKIIFHLKKIIKKVVKG